jgi:hypothetical protein
VVATEPAQRLHATVAASVVVLGIAYAVAPSAGLLTLPSPQHPIQDPWFTAMELLIIAIAPAMVGLTVVLHARASQERRPFGVAAIALMSMCAVITCCVHFTILTVSRELISTRPDWAEHLFSFLAYALGFLFSIAAFCGAATIEGGAIFKAGHADSFTSAPPWHSRNSGRASGEHAGPKYWDHWLCSRLPAGRGAFGMGLRTRLAAQELEGGCMTSDVSQPENHRDRCSTNACTRKMPAWRAGYTA